MLSKSQHTRGTNCQKSLRLYKHKRDEQSISDATMAIFARGTSVGELAQQFFPNRKMAVLELTHPPIFLNASDQTYNHTFKVVKIHHFKPVEFDRGEKFECFSLK